MATRSTFRKYLSTVGKILLLLIVAISAGPPAGYLDPYGILFVLVGGAALVMISFPGAEIWKAFRHAAGKTGNIAELRNSAHIWEAAGRSFWILGGLRSVLSIIIGFVGMRTEETASISAILPMLIQSLLSTFYGSLLAVISFVPCWKLLGIVQSEPSAPASSHTEPPISIGHRNWRFGTVLGYVIFLAALASTSRPLLDLPLLWPVFRPPLLVVFGGTLVLMLFKGGNATRLTPSTAFAGMGLIGSLMGFIQMLHGMTDPSVHGIGRVAGALAFILFSCVFALIGMAILGAPLEDRAIRAGLIAAPPAPSRVAWYIFPLLSLIFLILVYKMIVLPLPPS